MELNNYLSFIFRYISNSVVPGAIMLDGEWGVGKSYYLNNDLRPFLNNQKIESFAVSLFGVSDIKELELKISNSYLKIPDCDIKIGGLFDEKAIFESINYDGKLLILEDFERANLDYNVLFGFIHNLCEEKHAKILIVAFEKEIHGKLNDDSKQQYDKSREKVVIDTLYFRQNQITPLKKYNKFAL